MDARIDLQTHTRHSPACGWQSPATLVDAAADRLDGVAVTDHNTMDGVDAAVRAAPDDLLVVPGEEVDTPTGQVIGLFLEEPIEPWRPAADVIDDVHAQGGLAFAPHPFDALREGLEDIDDHVEELDAIETLNARCIRDTYNDRAREYATTHDRPQLGGSDAHFANEIGNAYTVVDVDPAARGSDGALDADGVAAAIRDGRCRPEGDRGSLLNHARTKTLKLVRRFR